MMTVTVSGSSEEQVLPIPVKSASASPLTSLQNDTNNKPKQLWSFRSNKEYIWAMKEDLAEWLNSLYELNLTADNFLDMLENGVILCRHANNVIEKARDAGHNLSAELGSLQCKNGELPYFANAKPKTFQARDNVANFIRWCRTLKIHECLLFETDDLVLNKNEKSFILCLLEVSRKCTNYGIAAPLLVQMEQEIDREIEEDNKSADKPKDQQPQSDDDMSKLNSSNKLRCLHERVVDMLNRCSCPSKFPMIKVADGKYRIGTTKVIIFVRVLRNHVMVRVGGGWDTLGHYLDRHDPCRCRSGHRFSTSAKLTLTDGDSNSEPQMVVVYDRVESKGYSNSSYFDDSSGNSSMESPSPIQSEEGSDKTRGDSPTSISALSSVATIRHGKYVYSSSSEFSESEVILPNDLVSADVSKIRKSSIRKVMRTSNSTTKKDNHVQVKENDNNNKRRSSVSSAPSATCKEYIKNLYNRDSRGSRIPHFVGHTNHSRTKSCDDLTQPGDLSWRAPLSAKESQANVMNSTKLYGRRPSSAAKPVRKNSADVKLNHSISNNHNNSNQNTPTPNFQRGRNYYASLPRNRSQPAATIDRSDQKYQSGRFSRNSSGVP